MKLRFIIALLISIHFLSVRAEVKNLIRSFITDHGQVIKSDLPIKSGTRYLLLMLQQWDQLSVELKAQYRTAAMQQPVREKAMSTPSGKFVLHWDENGVHAVPSEDISGNGIPDYIDSAAVIFDNVWEIEVNQLGFQAPLNEDGNTVTSYHVYFGLLKDPISGWEYYGLTVPSLIDIPSVPGINYPSYMEVHKDFAGFPSEGLEGLKVTAAHEFHHAIQFCYNVRPTDYFFFEMTSTWIENFIFPEIKDYYQYLPYFFYSVSNTRFDLYNATTLFPYGNTLYVQMLEKQYSTNIVQEIWERIKIEPTLNAINTVLSSTPYNRTWLESLSDYGLWLYYTGSRAIPGEFFNDAVEFPQVRIRSEDKINFNQKYHEEVYLAGLTNRYFELYGTNSLILEVFIAAMGSPTGGFRHLSSSSYSSFYPLNVPIVLHSIGSDTTVLVLCNAEDQDNLNTLDIKIAADVDLTSVYAYPNPVDVTSQGRNIRFLNVPPAAQLIIYNTTGKRVADIPGDGNSFLRTWDLSNTMGEVVASGVYIFYIQGDGVTQSGKLSIVR